MRAVVIINPIAGPGRRRPIASCAAVADSILRAHGYDVRVQVTTSPADAQTFAREAVADGSVLAVAWGGDGTVNGVAAALTGSSVALGIVPAGSGNGLARDLRLPSDPAAALTIAATGETRTIDAGEVDGSLFFNVAGVGLDAHIAARLAVSGARRGMRGYVAATLAELKQYTPVTYTVSVPSSGGRGPERIERRALFVAFANSRQYGNGALIAPRARLDDGEIDLVVVEGLRPARLAARVPALFLGRLRDGAGVVMRRSAGLTISAEQPMLFHVDGEPRMGGVTLSVRTLASVLRVRVRRP